MTRGEHDPTLAELLREIYDKHGVLTPALVVEAARPSSSPLHKHFEWDVTKNAQAYLEVQARQMIRSVNVTKIVHDTEPYLVRAYHAPRKADRPYEYVAIEDLKPTQVRDVLDQMRRDVASLRHKYRAHAQVLEDMLRAELLEA